ncbi:MAG: ribosome silencing factor [Christensenellaceae bacterium]|jgi:iojap-like protein|nr:ribosome silencing factor [Bacillota bacterium]
MENEEKKNANEATSKELAQAICLALSAKKAKDIATVYVREKSSLCDYFVIASGTSSTQVRAMGEYVEEQMEKQFSLSPVREEGMRDGRWSVLDYGDVIVHIMQDETRLFYHLERLWADGGNLEKYED